MKGLSQNFLIDGNMIRKIVQSVSPTSDDVVIEIGAGPGALTEALLATGCQVIAIEVDTKFSKALERLQMEGRLTVLQKDALSIAPRDLFPTHFKGKIKIVGNLPYHITTPLLERYINSYPPVEQIVVMVQDEVARRMTGSPKTSAYSSLTLFVNFYADAIYEFKVSRRSFYPVPKVDSAVVKLVLKKPPPVDPLRFFALTRKAFGHRRKCLKSSLKELYEPEKVIEALERMQLPVLTRPEELSLAQFLTLFNYLTGVN